MEPLILTTLLFKLGSDAPADQAAFDSKIGELVEDPALKETVFRLTGGACSLPVYYEATKEAFGTNEKLASARAEVVVQALIKAGVHSDRIFVTAPVVRTQPLHNFRCVEVREN